MSESGEYEEFEEFDEVIDYDDVAGVSGDGKGGVTAAGGSVGSAGGGGGSGGGGSSGVSVTRAGFNSDRVITLTQDEIFELIKQKIEELAEVLNWSTDVAALVLPRYNWSKERAQEQYFENPDAVMAACNINAGEVHTAPLVPNHETVECQLCWDDVQPGGALALQCFHWFCTGCWVSNLTHTIEKQGVQALPLKRCPHAKCGIPCGMRAFEAILAKEHPHHWRKYQRFLIKSFVDTAADFNFCVSPKCDAVVSTALLRTPECQEVKCERCSTPFCFKCLEEPHAPAECEMIKMWRKKEQDDSETANWMVVNTRPCPKCRRVTEKNGGCNHMKCPQCGLDWCWVCEGEWEKHGTSWYKCNYFDEKKDENTRWKKDAARLELEKYIFYYTRYRNHEQSGKLDQRTLEKARERIREEITRSQLPVYEVDYLERTAKALIRCRHVLKYSYIYSYFLANPKKKELFEYNQNMLEYHTELLSEYIEDRSGKHARQEVVNRTSTAELMLKKLEEGIYQGA